MPLKNSWLDISPELFSRFNNEDKIECSDNHNKTDRCNCKNGTSSWDAFVLSVCSNENFLCENEKYLLITSISQLYESLRNVFSTSPNSNSANLSSKNSKELALGCQCPENSMINASRKCYFSFILSNYLQNYYRIKDNSFCKSNMLKIASSEKLIFFFGNSLFKDYYGYQDRRSPGANIAWVSMKLNEYQNKNFQRDLKIKAEIYSNYCKIWPDISTKRNKATLTLINQNHSNKAIQCSKNTEFLKISPDVKFSSRSSLIINVDKNEAARNLKYKKQRRVSEPFTKTHVIPNLSMEYFANYKPQFNRENHYSYPNLRNFSTNAIPSLQKRTSRARRPNDRSHTTYLENSRLRRRGNNEYMRDTINQSEADIIEYSNFVEDDLISFRDNNKYKVPKKTKLRNSEKKDIQMVKKILIEDYITEVREIIRSEKKEIKDECEAKILENVKKRMIVDLMDNKCSSAKEDFNSCKDLKNKDDWYSISNTESRTAHEVSHLKNLQVYKCCYCRHYGEGKDLGKRISERKDLMAINKPLRICRSCSIRRDLLQRRSSNPKNTSQDVDEKLKNYAMTSAAKSRHSVDSGVLMDCSYLHSECHSSDDGSCYIDNNGSTDSSNQDDESSSLKSFSDDVLSQRVESAVKKFTEELILCERRVKDRSNSVRWRRDKRRVRTPKSDSIDNICNYLKNSKCISEDEYITEISTPSLVSLSDSDNLSSSKST